MEWIGMILRLKNIISDFTNRDLITDMHKKKLFGMNLLLEYIMNNLTQGMN